MHIVSLGPYCITKNAINRLNYESKAMPFDWMFSSLDFIQKVIEDDFNILLDKNYINSTNPCWDKNKSYNTMYNNDILQSKTVTTHLLTKNELPDYHNFHMWMHYNLVEDEHYSKYNKYVDRFKSVIKSSDTKLFIYVNYYDDNNDGLVKFNDFLNKSITSYKLLCIHCKKVNNINNIIQCSYYKNNLYIYELELTQYQDYFDENQLKEIKQIIDLLC